MKLFAKLFAALGMASALLMSGSASALTEGKDYKILPKPIAVEQKDKVEVIEFFGYFCPHCYKFEPELKTWIKKQGKDVVVRKVPVSFHPDTISHVKLFYTLEAMGKLDALHEKVFYAFHKDHKRLLQESEIVEVMVANGVDKDKFLGLYRSMGIDAKARGAVQLFDRHAAPGIMDGVPTLVVQGKYVTAPSMAGANTTKVLDSLIADVRAKRK